MKPGDLICYNAGGMKYKTLGLVIELKNDIAGSSNVLIMWGVVGELMPRKSFGAGLNLNMDWSAKIHNGEVVWHPVGGWFEVISESR